MFETKMPILFFAVIFVVNKKFAIKKHVAGNLAHFRKNLKKFRPSRNYSTTCLLDHFCTVLKHSIHL
jgi:hypothetical protein